MQPRYFQHWPPGIPHGLALPHIGSGKLMWRALQEAKWQKSGSDPNFYPGLRHRARAEYHPRGQSGVGKGLRQKL